MEVKLNSFKTMTVHLELRGVYYLTQRGSFLLSKRGVSWFPTDNFHIIQPCFLRAFAQPLLQSFALWASVSQSKVEAAKRMAAPAHGFQVGTASATQLAPPIISMCRC